MMTSFKRSVRSLLLFAVGVSIHGQACAGRPIHRKIATVQNEAVCSFVENEEAQALRLISAHGGPERDSFVAEMNEGALGYRYRDAGLEIDYATTRDHRILISRVRMMDPYLSRRIDGAKQLEGRLQLGGPLPQHLKLGCDSYELEVFSNQGRVRSLMIEALID
jgi:hypothetical protein